MHVSSALGTCPRGCMSLPADGGMGDYGMPTIRYTRHARNRMRLWHLTEADVMELLTQPDCVTPSRQGREHVWKQPHGGWLRVTSIQEGQTTVVVTVTVRRRGPEGG